jgi:hypothetical protein
LLQHVLPNQFVEAEDLEASVSKLFTLAMGAKEPEAIRLFAQTYLRCHHPRLSATTESAKQLGIKPKLSRDVFTEERIWPLLSDTRADVRRFAVDLTRVELRNWGAHKKVYELGDSSTKEVRNICYDALTMIGDPNADPELSLSVDELVASEVFAMTESRRRSTRDVAMEVIRKHYGRIGGAERLGWLMQSADREVRMFAVRLLWERHRPRSFPKGWQPKSGHVDDAGTFEDVQALRDLLRRLLFMVPPTRSAEQGNVRRRRIAASTVKRNVIEIVRDIAATERDFAVVVAPVLGEFANSVAKGEWHACLQALVQLRAVHPEINAEGLV